MVEHDFYKLMQIPLYSDYQVVKKRYYELALLYHPDKHPNNKDAEEYFKIVTQGYNELSDAGKKMAYDQVLQNYYFYKVDTPKKVQKSNIDVAERLFQNSERKRQNIISDYLEAEQTLSHKYRLLIAILLSMSGFLMTYNHWFINYHGIDIIYNFAGFLITYFGVYLIANNIYRRDAYKNAIHLKHTTADRRAVSLFLTLFFTLPVIFYGIVETSAKVQLTYFYDYTTCESIKFQEDMVFYEYIVNDEKILRSLVPKFKDANIPERRIRVKFSRLNPRISEIIVLE
jgi:hypothetical protein